MCLLFLYFRPRAKSAGHHDVCNGSNNDYRFVMVFNRDEYYARPTMPADYWTDLPGFEDVLAGRDVHPARKPGTWLGVSRSGKVGALTNYRLPSAKVNVNLCGRGELVTDFLRGEQTPRDYLARVSNSGDVYNGFNLVLADVGRDEPLVAYYSNVESLGIQPIPPGIYGLCNKVLDSPWPKLLQGKRVFTDIIGDLERRQLAPCALIARLLALMADESTYPDDQLPDTGIPKPDERALSAINCYIPQYRYGTRSTTIVLVDDDDNVTFVEKTLNTDTGVWDTSTFTFAMQR